MNLGKAAHQSCAPPELALGFVLMGHLCKCCSWGFWKSPRGGKPGIATTRHLQGSESPCPGDSSEQLAECTECPASGNPDQQAQLVQNLLILSLLPTK